MFEVGSRVVVSSGVKHQGGRRGVVREIGDGEYGVALEENERLVWFTGTEILKWVPRHDSTQGMETRRCVT